MASKVLELSFHVEDDDEVAEISTLFAGSGKPVGEVRLADTRCLITKHYVRFANEIRNLKIRSDDVWVVSFPRSGTTLVEEMVWLLANDLNYAKAGSEYLHRRFMNLELVAKSKNFKGASEFHDVEAIKRAASPRYIKSHLPIELLPIELAEVKPKIFYVYRNPKDVAVSMYHFFKLIYKFRGTFEQFANDIFLKEKLVYQPYWSHVLNFWEYSKCNDNVVFVSYEEMNKNMTSVVHKISKIFNVTPSDADLDALVDHLSIEKMRKNTSINKEEQMLRSKIASKPEEVQFIRRGIINEWKEMMNESLADKFDDWTRSSLESSDFKPFY